MSKWETVKLGDVCNVITKGTTPTTIGYDFQDSGINFIKIESISENGDFVREKFAYINDECNKKMSRSQLQENDILFSIAGAIGRTAIVSEEILPANTNQALSIIRIKSNTLKHRFVVYALKSDAIYKQFEKQKQGVAQLNLSLKNISDLIIPIPPLQVQKQIAFTLDLVTDLINKRKKQLEKLDELVKSRFVEMFGDPILNQKNYPLYKIEDIVEFQGGSQPDKKYFEYEPTEDNIRLIQIRDYKTDKYITYIPKSLAKRFCTADDIMIGRYGPPIFQILQGIEGSFNVALMKAIPKKGNKDFIRYFLKQDCLLHYLEGLSQRTAGQDGIQMDKLKAYPFPYPPLELQNQFAAFAEATDKSKFEIQKSIEKLETLKKTLMQEYFG